MGELFQQRDRHIECSRNLKSLTPARVMNAGEEKPGNELEKQGWDTSWRAVHAMLSIERFLLFTLQTSSSHGRGCH